MAPGARLYLVCAKTLVAVGEAEAWLKTQESRSSTCRPGSTTRVAATAQAGQQPPDAIVADARANRILWVNSAGNEAEQH